MKPIRVLCWIMAMVGISALPLAAEDEAAAPQLSFFKFEWRGDIKEAHVHALNILKGAGYRVPEGQDDLPNVSYGTLPKGSIQTTLMAHILCSTVKHENDFYTEVTTIVAGNDIATANAECEKLHELMRHAGGTDREEPNTVQKGKRETSPAPGNDALIYAFDVWSTYKGEHKAAAAAGRRVLDEMEFKPDPLDLTKLPSVQTGANPVGGLAAAVVATDDHLSNIQMHIYTAVCYHTAKNANQNQLLTAMNQAKDIAHHYVFDMTHIKDLDPGNSIPVSHPK